MDDHASSTDDTASQDELRSSVDQRALQTGLHVPFRDATIYDNTATEPRVNT